MLTQDWILGIVHISVFYFNFIILVNSIIQIIKITFLKINLNIMNRKLNIPIIYEYNVETYQNIRREEEGSRRKEIKFK